MREGIKKHICKWRMPKIVVIRLKDVQVGSQNGGMVQKRVGPGKRAEKREKRDERDKHEQDK